jgi:hypothetical protein
MLITFFGSRKDLTCMLCPFVSQSVHVGECGNGAVQFPEKDYINGIFDAVLTVESLYIKHSIIIKQNRITSHIWSPS